MSFKANKLGIGAIILVIVVVASILIPKPRTAWNSGGRDKLTEELRVIAKELVVFTGHDSGSFGAEFIKAQKGLTSLQFADRYGVTVNWYQRGTRHRLFFCPIAFSAQIAPDADATYAASPQILMAPLEDVDSNTLPILFGCEAISDSDRQKCQIERLRELFLTHGIEYAATLMSDGRVAFVSVDELFNVKHRCLPSED